MVQHIEELCKNKQCKYGKMNDSLKFYLPAHLTSSSDSDSPLPEKKSKSTSRSCGKINSQGNRTRSKQSKRLSSLRPWETSEIAGSSQPHGKLRLDEASSKSQASKHSARAKLARGLCKYLQCCLSL